jgi:hypothetical protein
MCWLQGAEGLGVRRRKALALTDEGSPRSPLPEPLRSELVEALARLVVVDLKKSPVVLTERGDATATVAPRRGRERQAPSGLATQGHEAVQERA